MRSACSKEPTSKRTQPACASPPDRLLTSRGNRQRGVRRGSVRRVLRHRISRRAPGAGRNVRGATRMEDPLGGAAIRPPRSESRLRMAAHDRAHGTLQCGYPRGHLPPGRGGVPGRRHRRPLGRHHDGLHPARRSRHGDALRHDRPRPGPLACPGGGIPLSDIARALEHESGLYALAGSSDMPEIEAMAA
jgi:hypothetical protein